MSMRNAHVILCTGSRIVELDVQYKLMLKSVRRRRRHMKKKKEIKKKEAVSLSVRPQNF